MSRHLDAETVSSFWTDIQKATAQSNNLAGAVAQRVPHMSGSDAATNQAAANALLASLTQGGLNSQRLMSSMYPPPQFDTGSLTSQSLARVDEQLLPIGSHQLQQHQQSAGQQQLPTGKISSSEAFPTHLQAAAQPATQPSASDSDEEGRAKGASTNGESRKSQLKEKNRKAQKRFRERQKVNQVLPKAQRLCQAVVLNLHALCSLSWLRAKRR